MTPFGQRLRELRAAKGMTQIELADALQVSSSYLSALEHGKRGKPTWDLLQRIMHHFQIIWDDAEELQRLAQMSDPKVSVNTAKLPPKATLVANEMADRIAYLDDNTLDQILALMKEGTQNESRRKLTRRERLIFLRRRKLKAQQNNASEEFRLRN